MVLPRSEFLKFTPTEQDMYYDDVPVINLVGLQPKQKFESCKLSILISTYNRKAQFSRTLETLARQTMKDFEILVMDDGSTQDLCPMFDLFDPYLHIKRYKRSRDHWRSCPSTSYKMMLPDVKGDVIVIMHPEMMIHQNGMEFLYNACIGNDNESYRYCIGNYEKKVGSWIWGVLKPCFLDRGTYKYLNTVDWHSNFDNFFGIDNFGEIQGFACRPNKIHATWREYPWWFVGGALKESPIWADMPDIIGHGIIDMWMCRYRMDNNYVDIASDKFMCLHQPHQTSAYAPEGEQGIFVPKR